MRLIDPMRRSYLALLALILLAWILRLHHLDVQSLWYDEGVTAQVARMGVRELARWTADDIQPPLYYLMAGGWLRLIRPWEAPLAFTMRLLSAAMGVLLVPVLWALGRRLWNGTAGMLAALVAAISPLMVYYGQEARMYALLVTLVSLAALAVVRLAEPAAASRRQRQQRQQRPRRQQQQRPRRWLAVYALAALAALYTHYFAGFALLALGLYWLFVWWHAGRSASRHRRRLLAFAAANALVVIGFLPWLPAMLTRFQADSSYWSGTLKLAEALRHTAINLTAAATETMLEGQATALLPWFGLVALTWIIATVRSPARRPQRPSILLLLWGVLPLLCILFLAYRTPKFNPRYLMISWPVWALLAGGGVAALWRGIAPGATSPRAVRTASAVPCRKVVAIATLAFVLVVQTAGLRNWFTDAGFAKSDWRDAISQMYFHRQPDEVSLLVSGHAYPVFDAYVPAALAVTRYRLPEIEILDVNRVLGWEETAQALNRDLAGKGGVWLFLWQNEVVDPAGVVTTLLDRYAEPVSTPAYPFIGLRHYRLRPGHVFPETPPVAGPTADFGGLVRLIGLEPGEGGYWLYWQGLQPGLPDLLVDLKLLGANGEVLAQQEGRPAGYDFPTTRWQPGATYPVWLPTLDTATRPMQLHMRIKDAGTGRTLGEHNLDLAVSTLTPPP